MSRQQNPESIVPSMNAPLVSGDAESKFTDEGVVTVSPTTANDPPISSIDKNEPIVTRKELWSYYCKCFDAFYIFS